jgi:hypothetical protein
MAFRGVVRRDEARCGVAWRRTTLECTYRTFTNANGCELCEYCVNECERDRPHRANSVTGCEFVRKVCEFGVTMARIVCEPRK